MLNTEQQKVVNCNNKYIYINAGAGAGKTYTICQKIIKLIESDPDTKILCLTFTDMACKEIQHRLKNYKVVIKTFHKYILDLLKLNSELSLLEDYNFLPKEALLKISRYKNGLTKIKPFFYNSYEQHKNLLQKIDFDDIFLLYLQKEFTDVIYDYVFIDEFQDTNNLQFKVLKKIVGTQSSLICVGDNNQSIYGFRGTEYQITKKFINEFKATQFNLTENYRSDKLIIQLSNYISKQKNLIPTSTDNGLIKFATYDSIEIETKTIINQIIELIASGVKSKDICVLARTNNRLYDLQRAWNDLYYSNSIPSDNLFRTIHSVKGLEFKYVFIIGLENNTFPKLLDNSYNQFLEEKRLFYVAITRARKGIFLSYNSSINTSSVFAKSVISFMRKKSSLKVY